MAVSAANLTATLRVKRVWLLTACAYLSYFTGWEWPFRATSRYWMEIKCP